MRARVFLPLIAALCLTGALASGGYGGSEGADAVRACQQGGYLTLTRSDFSVFKNVGECIGYFVRGGTGVAPCAVVPGTSGCLTYSNAVIGSNDGWTLTLNAAFSFSTTSCVDSFCAAPNDDAVGGGSYVIKNATGVVQYQGTLSASNTGYDGLQFASFLIYTDPAPCAVAGTRRVAVTATSADGGYVSLYTAVQTAYQDTLNEVFVIIRDHQFSGQYLAGLSITC
jgi:hypothetical protein